MNASVSKGSILALTLFVLFINDFFASTTSWLYWFTDNATLHCFLSYATACQADTNIGHVRVVLTASLASDLG